MKISIETRIKAPANKIWAAWNTPEDILQWNAPSEDWHTTQSTVDLREGGRFCARMEARDGSMGFDFEATYTSIVPQKFLGLRMSDGREITVEFLEESDGVLVKQEFDAETENSPELQRQGWQAILDSFRRHAETLG